MKMAKLLLFSLFVSFGLATLPMEYNSQKNEEKQEEQKESTREQNIPSLVDLSLDAVSHKILFPVCEQTTAENLENTQQKIQENLNKLPTELQENVQKSFTEHYGKHQVEIREEKIISNLPLVQSWNTYTSNNFQAVIDNNNTLHIFDADTEQTSTITPDAKITTFSLAATQPILACALEDGRIQLWNLKNSSCIKTIQAQLVDGLPFVDLIISPTLKYLAASNGKRQAIRIWDIKTEKELNHAITNMPETDMHLIEFTPTNALIVKFQPYRGGDESMYHQLWNLHDNHCITLPKVSFATLTEIECSPKGKFLACKYHRYDDAIGILDTTTGTLRKINKDGDNDNVVWFKDCVQSFKFSTDEKHLIVASGQHLFIIDLMNNSIKEIPIPVINYAGDLPNAEYDHNCIINLNKRYFVTIGKLQHAKFGHKTYPYARYRIFVWDIMTGTCIQITPITIFNEIYHRCLSRERNRCLSEKNKIIMYGIVSNNLQQTYFGIFTFDFTSDKNALDILPLEYALKNAESKDDDESRIKAKQLREQIEAMYKPKSESKDKSDKSEEK